MANCNYKVNIKDIQSKYFYKIFCASGYDDSDLRKMVESIFYALPRTTGTGTSVTLNDTAFSYLKNKLGATDTTQEGTPTPDSPQTIHTITGNNKIKSSNSDNSLSNSVLLTLGDTEICKIGNYEDKIFKAIKGNEIYDSLTTEEQATLDYGSWYLRKNSKKLVFNGEENWTTRTSGALTLYELSVAGNNLYSTTSENLGLCNQYISKQNLTDDNTFRIQNGLMLTIHNQSVGSLTNFKNDLGTTNLIVYYPLATPTNEKFNSTNQDQLEDIYNNMLSYEGITNISQENADLPFNINATAIKDLNNLGE